MQICIVYKCFSIIKIPHWRFVVSVKMEMRKQVFKCVFVSVFTTNVCLPFNMIVKVFVTVCVKGILTDAGAEVSILHVHPVVDGVAVVAAHRLQLDLLDLHGLCDGSVGSSCRRRCQTWREEEKRQSLQNTACLLGLSHCTCKTFQKPAPVKKENKQIGLL